MACLTSTSGFFTTCTCVLTVPNSLQETSKTNSGLSVPVGPIKSLQLVDHHYVSFETHNFGGCSLSLHWRLFNPMAPQDEMMRVTLCGLKARTPIELVDELTSLKVGSFILCVQLAVQLFVWFTSVRVVQSEGAEATEAQTETVALTQQRVQVVADVKDTSSLNETGLLVARLKLTHGVLEEGTKLLKVFLVPSERVRPPPPGELETFKYVCGLVAIVPMAVYSVACLIMIVYAGFWNRPLDKQRLEDLTKSFSANTIGSGSPSLLLPDPNRVKSREDWDWEKVLADETIE